MLKVEGVSKVFSDGTKALDDVSFSVGAGELVLVAGSNGSGKTVLMNLIAGLERPSEGKIILKGEAGLVFQDADCQILGETPYEDVAFGVKNLGVKKSEVPQKVSQALENAGILHKKDSQARTMSGGEKRRLAVAGILAMDRDLILFDEPFANLDYPGVKNVCRILKELKDSGKTLIVLTHETEKIMGLSDRMVVLDKGRIRFDGTPLEGLKHNLEKWSIRNPVPGAEKFSEKDLTEKLEGLLWL